MGDHVRAFSLRLPAVLSAGLIATFSFAVPAQAALACAPDPYEKDTAATAAPLPVGGTTTRAICQEPTPLPRTESPRDDDWFAFTATGTTAYTVQAVDVGAALANDAYDRGGLELALWRLGADGKLAAVDQNRAPNGDRILTAVLPAGRYVVRAGTGDQQVYPATNTMDVKTVQGSEGRYGVRLTESAPAPVVTSFTLSSSTVRSGSSVTATYTLSSPAPSGGMYVDVRSSHVSTVYPGSAFAPAGATRVSVPITVRRTSAELRVTLTAWAMTGPRQSVVLTVRP
jgi:hypothetical protein